jgi:putative membrane protein
MKKSPIIPSLILLFAAVSLQACHSGSSGTTGDTTQTAAQASPTPSADGPTKADSSNVAGPVLVSKSDQGFMSDAADGGMTEIKASQVAGQQATNPRVKQFAAMMVTDHSNAGDRLKALAQSKNVPLPPDISDQHQKAVDELKQKSGADFDKAYMKMMVKDHQEVVHAFEHASGSVQDSSLKNFIVTTLPTLRMHLDSAKAIERSL